MNRDGVYLVLTPAKGCELADALQAHREHVRDVLIKPPGLIDDPGVDLPVLGEVRAAADVMGVLNAVRRRRGHGVQVDRDGASRLNRRTTHRTGASGWYGKFTKMPSRVKVTENSW